MDKSKKIVISGNAGRLKNEAQPPVNTGITNSAILKNGGSKKTVIGKNACCNDDKPDLSEEGTCDDKLHGDQDEDENGQPKDAGDGAEYDKDDSKNKDDGEDEDEDEDEDGRGAKSDEAPGELERFNFELIAKPSGALRARMATLEKCGFDAHAPSKAGGFAITSDIKKSGNKPAILKARPAASRRVARMVDNGRGVIIRDKDYGQAYALRLWRNSGLIPILNKMRH